MVATFKVVDVVPLPLEYQPFECSKCGDWFVWPKKDYIKSKTKPKFCPHCGAKFSPQQEVVATFRTIRPVGLDKTLLECSACKGEFEWPAFKNSPKHCPLCGREFTDGTIDHPVKR